MNKKLNCPALVISAPSSGAGKTTVVAALARHFVLQGKKVQVFKTGPDFIDPKFLEFASGQPVYQLDFWMCGLAHCQALIAKAALTADLILIEGVMGMFDGHCSSADIAATLGIDVLAVIDASAMAQTFGALAFGLANFRDDINLHGVIANRVGSAEHALMLEESLPEQLKFCGYLPRESGISVPERHLGLVQADELNDLDARLNLAAELIGSFGDIELPALKSFVDIVMEKPAQLLMGQRIAIAKDKAFSFIYRANIELLNEMGAELIYFSPIAGDSLPQCDALYLPGGYPELSLDELAFSEHSENKQLISAIQAHVLAGKPALAECGGMLYLNQRLITTTDESYSMCGVLQGTSSMQTKLAALGMVEANFTGKLNQEQQGQENTLRGHTFHYSTTQNEEQILCQPMTQRGYKTDPVWIKNKLIASYIHWYFPSNPRITAQIFLGQIG